MAKPSGNSALQETDIGPVPEDWGLARLRELTYEATERNQRLAYGREDVLSVDNELGLIPSDRLLGEDFTRYKLVRQNQFAYNPMRLNVGSLGLWKDDRVGVVSPDYIVFGCREDQLDSDFLDLFRGSAAWKWQIQRSGQGSVRIRYYYRHIAEFWVPRPPLPEQRAIARVLRTVQQAKKATEKVIAATRQLKTSLMRHLFTYGPAPVGETNHVPLRETDYGSLPESWDLVPLGSLISEGPQNGLYKHASCYGDGTPILRIDAFNDGERMERQQLKRLHLSPDEIETYALRENDIVINRVNGSVDILAKAAYVGKLPEPTVFESNMMRLAVDTKATTTRYIICYLLSRFAKKQLREKARVVHQASINQQDLKSLLVPLPQPVIQKQIAHCIAVVERRIDAERARSSALATLFNSLLHHLMTGKLRVRDLDPTDHSHDGTAAG